MPVFFIASLFFLIFFSGSLIGYGLLPPFFSWLVEPIIATLLFFSFISNKLSALKFPFLFPVLLLSLIGASSAILNANLNESFFIGIRLVLRFYFLFVAIINLYPSEADAKKLNKILVWCFLLQLPAAMVKFAVYGQGEFAIGLYSNNEGSLSTILPLIAIGFAIAMFISYGKARLPLILIVLFIGFSFIGGKRGLIFLLPITLLYVLFLSYFMGSEATNLLRKVRKKLTVLAPMLLIVFVYAGFRLIPTLNPEREVGGDFDLSHGMKYAEEYVLYENPDYQGYTGGRLSSTIRIFETAYSDGWDKLVFGYSPGSYTESIFRAEKYNSNIAARLKIQYGLTPLGYIQIEYGLLGVLSILLLFVGLFVKSFSCMRRRMQDSVPYWRGFFIGWHLFAFNMIVLFFTYHQTSLLGDEAPLVYFYVSAIGIVMDDRLRKRDRITMA